MADVVYRAGYWTDICTLPDGRFAQVTTEGNFVRCYVGGGFAWATNAREPLMFCRCAVQGATVTSIHQGNTTGTAYLVSSSGVQSLGPTFGVQPVAIDDTYAYVVRDSRTYDRIRLSDGVVDSLPHGAPGSSQGISDVRPNGDIWWADAMRHVFYPGLTLTYPNERGGVFVGQADPPQIAGRGVDGFFTAILGESYEPHIAYNGRTWAIVARTPRGAAYVEAPPFPAFITAPVIPPPAPKPEPAPMPSQLDTIKRIRADYGTPLTDWRCIVRCAQAIGAQVFRKDAGDHILLEPKGLFISRTIIGRGSLGNTWVKIFADGEGAATPIWSVGDTPADGEYVDVSDIDTGQPKPVPVPQPNPQPVPPGDEIAVLFAQVKARLDKQDADIAALKAWTQGVK